MPLSSYTLRHSIVIYAHVSYIYTYVGKISIEMVNVNLRIRSQFPLVQERKGNARRVELYFSNIYLFFKGSGNISKSIICEGCMDVCYFLNFYTLIIFHNSKQNMLRKKIKAHKKFHTFGCMCRDST